MVRTSTPDLYLLEARQRVVMAALLAGQPGSGITGSGAGVDRKFLLLK